MEHTNAVSPSTNLSSAALSMVCVVLLVGTPVLGWLGHVLAGAPMDHSSMGGSTGRRNLRLQRLDAELGCVDQPDGDMELGPLGHLVDGTGLAESRQTSGLGGYRRLPANA